NAKVIAQAGAATPGPRLDPPEVETNLIWFEVDPELGTSKEVAAALKQRGVLIQTPGPHTMRACTHLDVSAAQAERAADAIRRISMEGSVGSSAKRVGVGRRLREGERVRVRRPDC